MKKHNKKRKSLLIGNRPRGDATPVKKFNGKYMPVPFGPAEAPRRVKKRSKKRYA